MNAKSEFSGFFEKKGHKTLLTLVLVLLVFNPFFLQFQKLHWLMVIVTVLVLLAATRTVAKVAIEHRVAMALAICAVLPHFGVLVKDSVWLEAARHVATIIFLLWVSFLLLRNIIVRSHDVTVDLLLGAINVYLMVGIGFAFMFGLIELFQPGSFSGVGQSAMTGPESLPFLYFSFVSLTTLGYGDITPLTPFGMTTAYLEALFGQLYLAIMIARLVGLYISRSAQRKPEQ
jgi:hypothetical protein